MDDNSVQQLFSSCPKLEKLDLFLCEWSSVKAVHVSAPVLEHLEIYEVAADLDTEPDCQFMIAGPRLKFFHYTGELKNDYCIFDSPLLVDAHVDVDLRLFHMNTGGQRQAAYRAHKLLRGLANVKDLHVSPRTLNVLLVAEELVACLPLFHNLNHLEVSGGTLNFASGTLLKILQNSPHLESIYFAMGIRLSALSVRDGWRLDPVPPCFLTHLKTLKVELFHGDEDEVNVVKTVLKSARVLERIELGPKNKVSVVKTILKSARVLERIEPGSKKENKIRNVILDLFKECMNSNVVLC